jgi:hypothetical protein
MHNLTMSKSLRCHIILHTSDNDNTATTPGMPLSYYNKLKFWIKDFITD